MKNKSLLLSIFLILAVILSSSAVFAEDTADASLQQADDVDTIQEAIVQDEKLSAEYTVAAGSTGEQIQAQLDSMSDGDVLNLEDGTYTDVCIYVNKSITINGNGAKLVGFDNPSINTTPSIITNTSANGGYGIGNLATLYVVKANNVTINGLTIVAGANSSSETAGPSYSNALVYVESSNNLVLKDNVLDGSSWGLYLRFSHDAQIVENQIKNQAVTGILNFGSARTQIERNTVTNAKNHGIDVRHGTGPNVQVINNTVIGSKEGIYLMHSQGHTAANNELINCTISSISCYGSSNIEIYNNTMKKSRIGILLGGGYKNINVGENTFNLNNLPYPPTFVYFIAEGKSDFQSADSMMGTHSDSSENPVYTEYTEIPTPKDINVNYATILNPTGTTYKVPAGTSSADIQTIIANLNDGDTLEFEENAVYNDVSIYVDKNVKVIGNNATLIGYDSVDLANVPAKVTASTDENGYALSNPAVLYVLNNTGAVISGLNIIAQYPGYAPLSTVPPTSMEYKTAGIRTKDSINVTITNCKVDGASWGIYLEFSRGALVTNNEISNQFTTGILNFGTGNSILANNTITDAVNHGIDVRHGTGPNVTVFNNTISGSKEGIYLMHSKGHSVYGNTITDSSISGITCYGSGNEKVFDNSISGSRIGILLGGGYYNVTIGKNSYSLDSLPFPPTFVTYLAKVETTYDSASKAVGVYSDKYDTYIDASDVYKNPGEVEYKVKLTDSNDKPEAKQTVTFAIGDDTYTAITDSEGIATLALNLTEGKYDVAINYAGTDNFKAASENVTITVSSVKVPANNTAEAIQAAIDAAQEGDTIDLTAFDEYDVGNATIEVPVKGITIQGSGLTLIKGWGGPGNGIFHVSANDVTFKGIVFKDTNPNSVLTYYDDATKGANEVKGWGIHFQRAQNGVVDNCVFEDFNHGVRIQQQANNVTVMNSVFTGVTNYLRNDPTVNVEKGTKAIGVMGSQNPTIINNTFNGPMLDAISLASGCAGALVSGNTFNGNSYSIYFGGASTGGTLIDNNTFINCGYFKGLDNNGTEVEWEALPVISIQKAAAGLNITNNNFDAINDNVLIAAEAGNTAHGYPSEIGNIDITGNTVTKFNDDVITPSVTLLHILSRGGDLNPTGPIDVSGNTFEGAVKALAYWNTAWGSENGNVSDIVIPKGNLAPTTISISGLENSTVTAVLKDINGNPLAGETVSYTIGNVTNTTETDENGAFAIAAEPGDLVEISFAETAKLAASEASITIPETVQKIDTIFEYESAFTRVANDYSAGERGQFFYAILKDVNGNVLANRTVQIAVNGPIYNVTTDDEGKAGLQVNLAAANTYTYAIAFTGDDQYNGAPLASSKLTLTPKSTSITASAKTFKASAKTKSISVTLKTVKNADGKTYLKAGKKLTLKVNGKTYTAKTNAKGVAKFTIKLTKKGKYTAKISFAGDKTYSASNKSIKVTIK